MEKLIKNIIGLRLESVSISRSSITFEVEGMKDGEHYRYMLGTMFEICFDKSSLFKNDIVDDESTARFWGCLEACLQGVTLSKDGRVCELKLDNSKSIYIWSEDINHDNLIVVRRHESDEWFTVG